jgi:regulator of sirC expression with transglutaminase-like and TPR domain
VASPASAPLRTTQHVGPRSPAAALRAILSGPEDRLDYARAKLAIDRLVDPKLDVAAAAARLDSLTAQARALAGASAGPDARLAALRRLIYEPGPWNDGRAFAYDHDDPLGQSPRSRLLPVYLATRLGNCVSMPILFLILADRLGLDMALAAAPLHMFVRWRDESGGTLNLETTSGALPARDAWFRHNMPMTDLALANGLYMRSLGRREGVALMAHTLLERLIDEGRYGEAIEVADVLVGHSPGDAYVMVKKATACAHIIRTEFEGRYPSPFLIPMPQRLRYLELDRLNRVLFEAAEALGWRPEDQALEDSTKRSGSCS